MDFREDGPAHGSSSLNVIYDLEVYISDTPDTTDEADKCEGTYMTEFSSAYDNSAYFYDEKIYAEVYSFGTEIWCSTQG